MGQTSEPGSYLGVTFQPNKHEPIHRWYPYVEGFSAAFVRRVLDEFGVNRGRILDPFGGCGTTAVVGTMRGLRSISIDINPFLCFVSRVKSNVNVDLGDIQRSFFELVTKLFKPDLDSVPSSILSPVFANKPYFDDDALSKIKFLKHEIYSIKSAEVRDVFALALASILVKVSRLKRAPDLKYAPHARKHDAFHAFIDVMGIMMQDLITTRIRRRATAKIINDNAIRPQKLNGRYDNSFDIVITSPPYLNGTNYYRNTKLEMWVLDYIAADEGLSSYRREAVTASINTTQMSTGLVSRFPYVQRTVGRIARNAYDRRIPVMVTGYFNDMAACLETIHRVLKPGRPLVLVIGDSFFGDTHIPTDRFLARIGAEIGFELVKNQNVRRRRSRGGFPLRESVLTLRKPSGKA